MGHFGSNDLNYQGTRQVLKWPGGFRFWPRVCRSFRRRPHPGTMVAGPRRRRIFLAETSLRMLRSTFFKGLQVAKIGRFWRKCHERDKSTIYRTCVQANASLIRKSEKTGRALHPPDGSPSRWHSSEPARWSHRRRGFGPILGQIVTNVTNQP